MFEALRKRSCARLELASCHPCELVPVCPISALVATVDPEWDRGADPPRPLVIEPPLEERTECPSGDGFDFGLTVLGSAGRLLPYVVLALGDAGKAGIGPALPAGRAVDSRPLRGRARGAGEPFF
ncbi:MAG: hypothetical protein ACYDAG_17295 [Chloroflexota bacterium]